MADTKVTKRERPERLAGPARQAAAVELALGEHVRLAARLDMTPGGILAVGGLVSMILLGTSAIVRAARSR